MKKFVHESLNEFLSEATVKKTRKQKGSFGKPAKTTVVYDESTKEKADQAIKALKVQLADAKKPGAGKSKADKDANIKAIQDKIDKWEAKKKKK